MILLSHRICRCEGHCLIGICKKWQESSWVWMQLLCWNLWAYLLSPDFYLRSSYIVVQIMIIVLAPVVNFTEILGSLLWQHSTAFLAPSEALKIWTSALTAWWAFYAVSSLFILLADSELSAGSPTQSWPTKASKSGCICIYTSGMTPFAKFVSPLHRFPRAFEVTAVIMQDLSANIKLQSRLQPMESRS